MKKVRKAIIPAAGLGTRFLPATKALAKEMLPIVDKPTIQFIIEEAIESGIEEILIVTGRGKRSIEDHFDSNPELEQNLEKKGKKDLLKLVDKTTGMKIHYVRQAYPKGLGDAVLHAKAFVGDEPFIVMLGDDIMSDNVPLTKQLINRYENHESSVLAVMEVPEQDVNKYGIVSPEKEIEDGLFQVSGFVEKPEVADAPSNLAIIGRYLLTPAIFELLETQTEGAGNEIQLTDAIDRLNKEEPVYAHNFIGRRSDVGDKLGFMKTSVEYALEHPAIKDEFKEYLKTLIGTL